MGYPDGYYYGQGRIICDTSTFSVGDTIRVRSMTDSSKVWNKQVATVGTALVFTVPPYDYYKICTVQDIGGTPTEIGGVYKTVDYGQTLYVDLIDKKSLAGIQGILNGGYAVDLLNISDEVPITIVSGGVSVNWIMQIGKISANEVIFVSKEGWETSTWASADSQNYGNGTTLRTKAQSFYNVISERDKTYIKTMNRASIAYGNTWVQYTDKIWIPSMYEALEMPSGASTPPIAMEQFAIFTSASGRIRKKNNTAIEWWTTDNYWYSGSPSNGIKITASGVHTYESRTSELYVLPCFHLTADS